MRAKIDKRVLKHVATRCGISIASARDLLEAGWTFNENYKGEITWTKESQLTV